MPDITYTPAWRRQRPSSSGHGGLVDEGGVFTVRYEYNELPDDLREQYEAEQLAKQEGNQSRGSLQSEARR